MCNILQNASKIYHLSLFEKFEEEKKLIDERQNVSFQLLSHAFCESEGH